MPIRLELGPRDLAAGTALMSRRLNYQQPDAGKEAIPLGSAAERLTAELAGVPGDAGAAGRRLPRRAHGHGQHLARIHRSGGDRLGAGPALRGEACEDEIKAATAATPRCIPLDAEPEQGPCIRCGKPSAYGKRVIFARAY